MPRSMEATAWGKYVIHPGREVIGDFAIGTRLESGRTVTTGVLWEDEFHINKLAAEGCQIICRFKILFFLHGVVPLAGVGIKLGCGVYSHVITPASMWALEPLTRQSEMLVEIRQPKFKGVPATYRQEKFILALILPGVRREMGDMCLLSQKWKDKHDEIAEALEEQGEKYPTSGDLFMALK